MNIAPKIFRAKTTCLIGKNRYMAGDEVPAGSLDLGRLIALDLVAEDTTSKTFQKTKTEEGSDANHE